MKKNQIIYMMCATALLSSCHIYKAYDRPETIDTSGLYRDPVSVTDTLAADTTNMGNLSWKEVFRDPKLQALIEEGLANNVDMQAAVLRVEEAKTLLTAARLSFLPSLNLAPQGSLTTMGGSSYAKAYTLPAAQCKPRPESNLFAEPVFTASCPFTVDRWYCQYLLYPADARPSGRDHNRNGCYL